MPEDPNDPVELYRARGPVEANALYAHLRAAGLPARLDNGHSQAVAGEVPGGWDTAVRLLVARTHLDAARQLLAEFLADARTAAPDELFCLACQAEMGTAATCPGCGWSYGAAEEPASPAEPAAASVPADPPAAPVDPPPAAPPGWGEVAAVLAVGVVPYLVGAVDSYLIPPVPATEPIPNWYLADALRLIGGTGTAAFVTLYLIHRSGEPWARFGLGPIRAWDFPLGLAIFLLSGLSGCCHLILDRAGAPAGRYWVVGPEGPVEWVAMVIKFAVSGFSEELITRAYLITRLEVLLRSRGRAVVLSAAAFALYHVYYGPTALVSIFLFGLVYGAFYLAVRRVWPLVFGHALYNILLELAASSRQ